MNDTRETPSSSKTSLRSRALLIILDGFGSNPTPRNNAVAEADTPHLDRWFNE